MRQAIAPERHKGANYLIVLDLVRFIAAILVMALHLGFWAWWKNGDSVGTIARLFPNYPEFPELISSTWFGWVGVQIFFVISGFVIIMTAEKASALGFLRSRFLRIYPVAWICATISLIIIIVGADQHIINFVFLRYLNTLIISPYPTWIDGVYWTLAVELVFYGSVFLMIAIGHGGKLVGFGIALGCASALYIAGLASDILPGGWLFTLLLLRHGVFFSIGILIWSLGRIRGMRRDWRNVMFLIIFIVLGVVEILYTAAAKLDALNLAATLYPPVVVWLVMLCCILSGAIWPDALNQRLFPARNVLRILGLATYPLYLVHQTVGGAIGFYTFDVGFSRGVALAIAVSTCVSTSIIVAITLEPRIRRFTATRFDAVVSGLQNMSLLSSKRK